MYRVYEHGSGKHRGEYEREREEQATRFRAKYGSEGLGADGERQGNVAPVFIGVFDTVAALGTVLVRRVLVGVLLLSMALAGWAWAEGLTPWTIVALLPAAFLVCALLGAAKRQFKWIVDGPTGKRFSWHFAAWNLRVSVMVKRAMGSIGGLP